MKNIRVLTPTELNTHLEALRNLADSGVQADANEPFSDQTWVDIRAGRATVVINTENTENPADQLIAAAAVVLTTDEAPILIEMLVHPDQRGQGWGSQLAQAVNQLVQEHLRNHPKQPVTAWTHGNHPAAGHLAEKYQLTPSRTLYRMGMKVSAGDHFDEALAEGYTLRTFEPGPDDAMWLKLNAEAFADHPEQGKLSQSDLDDRKSQDWFDAQGFFLAVNPEGTTVGFHWTKFPPNSTSGEVYAVGVSPAAQGAGLGRILTSRGLNHLVASGAEHIVLYVDAGNTPAVELYKSLGFTVENTDIMFTDTN